MLYSKKIAALLVVLAVFSFIVLTVLWVVGFEETPDENLVIPVDQEESLQFKVNQVADNLHKPWDIKLTSSGEIYFTQRQTGLYLFSSVESAQKGDSPKTVFTPEKLFNQGKAGMMGLDLSPNFAEDRTFFVCFNEEVEDLNPRVTVAKLTLNEQNEVQERSDLITDIESSPGGRHSGCRILIDKENVLWVTTGDAADSSTPQDPQSLNGKILRVDFEGNAIEGNLGGDFDPRIYSYGHRNVQGIALIPEDMKSSEQPIGYSAEHGSWIEDEVNRLTQGNFGWDPKPGYDESNVPMTDLQKFPEGISAAWNSGDNTIAPCGLEYVKGEQWKELQGDLLMAVLKNEHIRHLEVSENGDVTDKGPVLEGYGRIRQVYEAPDGNIYFTTDNGNNQDGIFQISSR
jgi:aldose sugar dehydrogenase